MPSAVGMLRAPGKRPAQSGNSAPPRSQLLWEQRELTTWVPAGRAGPGRRWLRHEQRERRPAPRRSRLGGDTPAAPLGPLPHRPQASVGTPQRRPRSLPGVRVGDPPGGRPSRGAAGPGRSGLLRPGNSRAPPAENYLVGSSHRLNCFTLRASGRLRGEGVSRDRKLSFLQGITQTRRENLSFLFVT